MAFYADKLCITSKYLTMVIKETSGKSAKDWIVEYVILEIKTLLKNTNMNIQEIAIRTNFANQSSLGRSSENIRECRFLSIECLTWAKGIKFPYIHGKSPTYQRWYPYRQSG